MTRSLQSPVELVKPHATSPLLPATSHGPPGSVTPVRRCARVSRHTIAARYQVLGADSPRCMSLATIAPPSAVRHPATAQLLLPRASSSAAGESHAIHVVSLPASACDGGGADGAATRASNTLASGIGGSACIPPTNGVSQSFDEVVTKSASCAGSAA